MRKGEVGVTARRILAVLCTVAVGIAGAIGCREKEPQLPQAPVEAQAEAEAPPRPVEIPTRLDIPVPLEESDRWLFVQRVADKAVGGWATGSFDAERNKLSIATSDIEGFAVDTSQIKINWQKLVVLSIDGRNSELRKRDYDILHFVRTPHGEWVVKEP